MAEDDGRGGEPLEVFTRIFVVVAGLLLLPRQWIACGIAAAIALLFAVASRRRARGHS